MIAGNSIFSFSIAREILMHFILIYSQTAEMSNALEKLDDENYINELVSQHFEDQNLLQVCYFL